MENTGPDDPNQDSPRPCLTLGSLLPPPPEEGSRPHAAWPGLRLPPYKGDPRDKVTPTVRRHRLGSSGGRRCPVGLEDGKAGREGPVSLRVDLRVPDTHYSSSMPHTLALIIIDPEKGDLLFLRHGPWSQAFLPARPLGNPRGPPHPTRPRHPSGSL